MKQKLFIYGTLKEPKVERKVIGRVLKLQPDVLPGFKKAKAKLKSGIYFVISPNKKYSVSGFVISVTPQELKQIDDYEGRDYKRVKVMLASGQKVWVYKKSRGWLTFFLRLLKVF